MMLSIAVMAVAVAIIYTSCPEQVRPARRTDSVFADILPRDNALIPALDEAYRDLEIAMRAHGCVGCHAPNLDTGGRRERVRHAVMLLDTRRSLEYVLEQNLMPPQTGITDDVERMRLLHRVRAFRILADAAVASW
jgi:hypothetical protein